MTRRVASAVLCFFYLGVVLCLGAVHDHQDAAARGDECVACKWQHSSVVDVPVNPAFINTVAKMIEFRRFTEFLSPSVSLLLAQSRAPPSPIL